MMEIELLKGSKAWVIHNVIKVVTMWIFTIPCQIAYLFCKNKDLIMSDVKTYRNMIYNIILDPYYRNLFYYRIGKLSVLFSWILPGEHIILPFATKLGRNAHFVHNAGSHLNAVSIGDDFICYQNVVLGSKSLSSPGRPIIGNNVTLATGVVIVGNIKIGNNVKIAANAFVNRSVPDNCVVVGNPAHIVRQNGETVDIKLQ